MSKDTTLNVKGLDQLLKALKGPAPKARVGILGSKDGRTGKQNSNATVGAAHEFGTTRVPQRSFLRVPISDNLQKYMEKSGALDKDVMAEVLKEGTVVPWLRKVSVLAERIVADAFDSGGFGKWTELKPKTMQRKEVKQILVESQQLRNSITSEVVE